MADAVQSLTHLEPPNLPVRLRLDRFSPYHRDPDRFGIEVLGPYHVRRLTYNLPLEDIADIDYFFAFRYKDGRNPDAYAREFVNNCAMWKESWRANFRRLSWHPAEDGVRVYDTRSNSTPTLYELGELEAAVYLSCEAGTTPRRAWDALPSAGQNRFSVEEVAMALQDMARRRLMFEENGRFISLAVEGTEEILRLHDEQLGVMQREAVRLGTVSAEPVPDLARLSAHGM
jgi:hypothetical protein